MQQRITFNQEGLQESLRVRVCVVCVRVHMSVWSGLGWEVFL